MFTYELIITLKSDLSVGSGDSIAGVVDEEITHEHGIPVIPAKRLKGALRGVAKELVDWEIATVKEVDCLFGKVGQEKMSGFKMFDATLYQLPEAYFGSDSHTILDYDTFLTQVKKHKEQELLKLFTMLYTKTAMAEGVGETGALRTIRVINKGLVFKSILKLKNENELALLENCVKGLRRLGMSRTRGLGEITCSLKKAEVQESQQIQEVEGKRAFRITLQQPTLLAGEKGLYYSCTNYIPGSALLGVFASLYIKEKNLGEYAHLNEDFARIFLRGGVTFSYAYPEVEHKKFIPCPAHLQRVKNCDEILYEKLNEEGKNLRKINTLVHKDGTQLLLHEPKQEFRMHHSRPTDRKYGRAINDTATGEEIPEDRGKFYYYTALQKGQQFVGELQGKKADVELLLDLLNRTNGIIHLGRSRTAEYGAAKVEVLDKLPRIGFEPPNVTDQTVAIYCATPLTLQNDEGRYVADVDLLVKQFERELGVMVTIEKMYLQQITLTGYNAKWRLPKPEREALDAGTVLIVSVKENVDWSLFAKRRWGEELGQGCGEVIALKIPEKQIKLSGSSVREKVKSGSEEWKPLLLSIEDEIERLKKARQDQVFIEEYAREQFKHLKSSSNAELYKLEQFMLGRESFNLPKDFNSKLLKIAEKLEDYITQNLKVDRKDGRLFNDLIQSFFHIIKLEVRKLEQ